jgi:hypothetical protein
MGRKDVTPEYNTGMLGELDGDEVCAGVRTDCNVQGFERSEVILEDGTTWLRKERIARRRRIGASAARRYRILCEAVLMRSTTGSQGVTHIPACIASRKDQPQRKYHLETNWNKSDRLLNVREPQATKTEDG